MLVHEFDLPRIHNAARMAEADEERLARIAQSARPRRAFAVPTVARLVLDAGAVAVLALRVLPIGI
jgi:hypothetical protein